MIGTVSFNGTALTDSYLITDVVRPLPQHRVTTRDVGGRDGSMYVGKTYGPVNISFNLWVLDLSSLDAMRAAERAIAALFDVEEPRALQFSDDGGRYYLAVPTGDLAPERHADGLCVPVRMVAPEAAMYGTSRSATVPSGGSVSVTVNGTYPTMPTVVASAAVRNSSSLVWGVRLDNADYLHVETGSSYGRAVRIDCAERTCSVAGSAKLPTLDSDWFELAPGSHTIRNDQGSGACTVTWVERWL